MSKKVVIIGAGMAGLSAGVYARMNGYEAEIYEMHDEPGGLCTSWKRKGFTIDGCIHWLTGSSPADRFYNLWMELGALQGRKIIDHEQFYRFTGTDGRTLILYCDADKLEAHLKELSPQDSETIELFCGMIRRFTGFNMPLDKAPELFGFFDIAGMILRMIPYWKAYKFCSQTTMKEFGERFRDPLLQEVFPTILVHEDLPLTSIIYTLALLHKKAGGYPLGGSLEFSRAIEKRFLDLGGKIFYKSQVEKILTGDGTAAGISLKGGKEIGADYVISAADLKSTVYGMLGGKYVEPMHEELIAEVKLFPSMVLVSFGTSMDFSGEPDSLGEMFKLQDPLVTGGEKNEWLMVKNYSFDPTLAPSGKTVVMCGINAYDYNYWEQLNKDKKAYREEKNRIAEFMADFMEEKHPGFKASIEMTDVSTPVTFTRYTGNWKGTFMTWVISPALSKRYRMIPKTLPGLKNFWLSGMWVMPPGGLPSGVKSSRDVIQLICRQDSKKFVAFSDLSRSSALSKRGPESPSHEKPPSDGLERPVTA